MSLFCTTFSLILGLYFLRNNLIFSILICLSYFLFILWRFSKRKLFIFLAFFGIGVFIPKVTLPINNGPEYRGYVIEARDNYFIFQSKFDKYYVKSIDNDFEIGDHLIIKGRDQEIKFATFESQFDFKTYLKNKGAQRELNVEDYCTLKKSHIKIHHFKKVFLSKFDENTASLISAFLFNDKDYSSEVIQLADNTGLLYLFSLSGIYLNILFAIANYLLFLKFSKKTSRILSFIIFLPLAFFSFTKIGTIRVYSLYFLKYLNEFYFKRRKFTHFELVSILALIFIAIDYHLVYQEAFYIGFLLSGFAPTIMNSVKCISKKKRRFVNFIIFYSIIFPIRISNSFQFQSNILSIFLIFPINTIFIFLSSICLFCPLFKAAEFVGGCEMKILKILE